MRKGEAENSPLTNTRLRMAPGPNSQSRNPIKPKAPGRILGRGVPQ